MSNSRWRVVYRPTMQRRQNIWGEMWEEPALPWLVKKVGRGGKDRRFKTLPEAHAHAMKMSRTVKVELPPVVGNKCIDPDMSPAMFVEKTPTAYGIFLGHRPKVGVAPSELRPLGEYLLSLHYAKESALNEPR